MKTPKPRTEGSKSKRPGSRRVSHRRELAIVTLGMVASITSLSGILAANPPSFVNTQEVAATSSVGAPTDAVSDATWDGRTAPAPDTTEQVSPPPPMQEPHTGGSAEASPEETPSWSSSHEEAPAAAKSRGS